MVDFSKPLLVRNTENNCTWPVGPEGKLTGNLRHLRIENVPVTHRRLAVLYTYKDGPPAGALFVDHMGLLEFIRNNPVVVVSTKYIELVEGERVTNT